MKLLERRIEQLQGEKERATLEMHMVMSSMEKQTSGTGESNPHQSCSKSGSGCAESTGSSSAPKPAERAQPPQLSPQLKRRKPHAEVPAAGASAPPPATAATVATAAAVRGDAWGMDVDAAMRSDGTPRMAVDDPAMSSTRLLEPSGSGRLTLPPSPQAHVSLDRGVRPPDEGRRLITASRYAPSSTGWSDLNRAIGAIADANQAGIGGLDELGGVLPASTGQSISPISPPMKVASPWANAPLELSPYTTETKPFDVLSFDAAQALEGAPVASKGTAAKRREAKKREIARKLAAASQEAQAVISAHMMAGSIGPPTHAQHQPQQHRPQQPLPPPHAPPPHAPRQMEPALVASAAPFVPQMQPHPPHMHMDRGGFQPAFHPPRQPQPHGFAPPMPPPPFPQMQQMQTQMSSQMRMQMASQEAALTGGGGEYQQGRPFWNGMVSHDTGMGRGYVTSETQLSLHSGAPRLPKMGGLRAGGHSGFNPSGIGALEPLLERGAQEESTN